MELFHRVEQVLLHLFQLSRGKDEISQHGQIRMEFITLLAKFVQLSNTFYRLQPKGHVPLLRPDV